MTKSATREAADGELFKSTGIDDNATSTAVTIDASENVGVGTASPSARFEVEDNGSATGNVIMKVTQDDQSSHYGMSVGNDSYSTVDSDGFVVYQMNNGHTYLYNGGVDEGPNIGMPVAGGITFGTDTAAANTLDDYEEGTFVATLRGVTSDPSTAVTTTSMYRKIGETVYITIAFENWSTTGASGDIEVTGLPFTSSPTGRFFITAAFYNGATWDDDKTPVSNVQANSTKILCHAIDSNGTWNTLTHNAGSSGRYFWFSGTYPTGS